MKAAIFDPYLDTLGGGERYSLAFAEALTKKGWEVDVEWKDASVKEKFKERFGSDLHGINFVPDVKKGSGYDLCFWVSDGSVPLLHSRKNIILFQIPFHDVDGRTLFNRMKLFRVNYSICYSKFVKGIIDKEYGIESKVIYPPVETLKIRPKRKENVIVYVGRFSRLKQSKGQEVLVKAFKKFEKSYPDWKLILAGGGEVGARDYITELRKESEGHNIEIIESPDFNTLLSIYGKAKIFWCAAGFGVNEKINPEKTEHFGMTTVEAMAAGAVPLVFGAGGQKEIVEDGINGFHWSSINELLNKTAGLIRNKGSLRVFSAKARERSAFFNYERFEKEISVII
jgi:glycosyltransferase involved in cell wall biosynthesis